MTKSNKKSTESELLESLGSKPSISEEHGLSLIRQSDLTIFSPGISTGGFAEIRMVQANPQRKVIATTIDTKGLKFAQDVIKDVDLQGQIKAKLEDLRGASSYPDNHFDFIYARLVLHYLSSGDLDAVLASFYKTLKQDGRLFVVVRSAKNVPNSPSVKFDKQTQLTSIPHYENGKVTYWETRYFHTPKTIRQHLEAEGFNVTHMEEYQEQLYKDFMRNDISSKLDHVIEVLAVKSNQELSNRDVMK
ncbi:class I SAM-dependent methyltransferase [Candidatus Woesebacteria bacterium]|nr:class I SAM-dependent methyltransferase [Candidatus Woesebacteria bacterium]